MANRRLELHDILLDCLGSGNVYFQPPVNKAISYPCIIYTRAKVDIKFANDKLYTSKVRYSVTAIDANPDSTIGERLLVLPFCSFDRHFVADKLNHDVYNIYY